mmetsp:Transcript_24071/g.45431  ORF Transcript_24071/g.45431 Transcript_24071/m.45431 type:complete len:219 (+) Transcript_24071:63-719(+)
MLGAGRCRFGLAVPGSRGFAKYARKGIWARGDYGQYTMDDPRVFRHKMRRQYPYHKQRQWSKPYMCLQHSAAAPAGLAVKLAVVYRKFVFAPIFYALERDLKFHLPGTQILGEALDAIEEPWLKIVRLNDSRVLWQPSPDQKVLLKLGLDEAEKSDVSEQEKAEALKKVEQELQKMLSEDLDSVVKKSLDHFDCRYRQPWVTKVQRSVPERSLANLGT